MPDAGSLRWRVCGASKKLHRTLHRTNDVCGEFAGGRPADAIGEEVLSWSGRIGTEFVCENVHSLDVCERLHLPMARKCANSAPKRCNRAREPFRPHNSRASLIPQVRPPISHRSALCLDVFPILDSLT